MDEEKKYIINIESNLDDYIKKADEARKKVDEMIVANLKVQHSETATSEEREKSNASLRNAQKEYSNAKKLVDQAVLANKAQAGSYEQLYRQWNLAQTQLKLMGDAYTVNEKGVRVLSQRYIEQSKVVADAKKALDAFGKGVNDNRLNVGNYTESIKTALGEMRVLPGALGQATGGIQRMIVAAKAFIATPLGAILAAIVGAVTLLVKAFKNSQPLMDAFERVSSAIAATFKVLLDRVSNFAEFLGSIFNKELRESRREAKALNDELIGIEETMSRREKRELRRANKKGLFEEIKEEAAAARDLTKAQQDLEDSEIAFIQRKAEMRRQIEELFSSTKDENLTDAERIVNLDKAIALTKEMTAIEVGFAKERARISQERVVQGNSTREELRANEEAQAAATEAEAQGFKEIKRLGSERFSLIKRITDEQRKAIGEQSKIETENFKQTEARLKKEITFVEARKKLAKENLDAQIKAIEDERKARTEGLTGDELLTVERQFQDRMLQLRYDYINQVSSAESDATAKQIQLRELQYQEELRLAGENIEKKKQLEIDYQADLVQINQAASIEAQRNLQAEIDAYKVAQESKKQSQIEYDEWNRERELINQENEFQIRELRNEYEFNIERDRLEAKRLLEIEAAERTGADINLINEKYSEARKQIDRAELNAKLELASGFAGNLAQIFGEQTAIGKAAAVAQTAINTYSSAQKSYDALAGIPIVGPALGAVAAAAAVVAGIANVKKILSVKSGLPGDSGGGAPTSISASAPAQRAFAPAAQSTLFTQPQLSQQQLNALPNQPMLTAEDIAGAVAKLPAPVVTVEDINARTAQSRAVEVRSVI